MYVLVIVTSSVLSVPPTKLPSTSQENTAVAVSADILATVYTPVVEFILTSTPVSEATLNAVFAFVVMSVFEGPEDYILSNNVLPIDLTGNTLVVVHSDLLRFLDTRILI